LREAATLKRNLAADQIHTHPAPTPAHVTTADHGNIFPTYADCTMTNSAPGKNRMSVILIRVSIEPFKFFVAAAGDTAGVEGELRCKEFRV
jgi:hypothetical protein